jgi:protein SCO1/2
MLALAAGLAAGGLARAASAKRYTVTGIVLKVDRAHRGFSASIAAIPGYMDAMSMPFSVRDAKELETLQPGAYIEFTLVVDKDDSWVEAIKLRRFVSMDREALLARRLQLLEPAGDQAKAPEIGQPTPDFTLTDQTGRQVSLRQCAGKVVALTFIYTSCPLPDYCPRLSRNFESLNHRFANRMGRDLILLSVTFDPVHDTPPVLAAYAATLKANSKSWHFLTGTLPEVQAVCRRFGLNFWQEEGLLTHLLHTFVIDRATSLVANFEGNEFTAVQLGDFVLSLMDR